MPGVTLTAQRADNGVAKFDLEMSLVEAEERLIVKAIYKAALFESSTIKQLLDHYQILLQGIVANPDERLLNLPVHLKAQATTVQSSSPTFQNTDEFTFDTWV